METTAFYASISGVAFTLLGLWWTALSFAYGGWRDDPGRRRVVLHVALSLLLLGTMGLTSLVSGPIDDGIIWRAAFVAAGLLGLREAVSWLGASRRSSRDPVALLAAGAAPLFALTIAAAFVPGNTVIQPRQIEALVVTANLLRALCVIWHVLAGWSAPAAASPPGGQGAVGEG